MGVILCEFTAQSLLILRLGSCSEKLKNSKGSVGPGSSMTHDVERLTSS